MKQNASISNYPEPSDSVRNRHLSVVIAGSGFFIGDLKMEIWKDIEGWEGIYQISNYGRLKSFKKFSEGTILSNKNSKGDYFSVNLLKDSRKRSVRMHVLVAEAFIPNPGNKPEVNHKDGNKQNNHVSNLEWMTSKENTAHAIENGLADFKAMNRKNQYVKPKPVLQIREDGKVIGKFHNCNEAGKSTGVCARNIHQVASKTEYKPGLTRSQAGGYRWEFFGN